MFIIRPDENLSVDFFRASREAQGVSCQRCGSTKLSYISTIKAYTCLCCKTRTTLKSGTALQNSKLPFSTWFMAFQLMSITKIPLSTRQIQKFLGLKYYQTAFLLMQKIRNIMAKSEIERICQLQNEFVKSVNRMDMKSKRNRDKNNKVLISNEIGADGYYEIHLLSIDEMEKYIPSSNADDGLSRSYPTQHKDSDKLITKKKDLSPWQRKHLLNFNRNVTCVFHGISTKYRQLYMSEFCFKTNLSMRKESVFDALLSASLSGTWWCPVSCV